MLYNQLYDDKVAHKLPAVVVITQDSSEQKLNTFEM